MSQGDELMTSTTVGADTTAQATTVKAERSGADRRTFTWKTIVYGIIRPRRRRARRADDRESFIVDIYAPWFMWVAVGLLVLSAFDAWLSLTLAEAGAIEQNLLLAKLTELSPQLFIGAKVLLTGLGVFLLMLLANFRVFGYLRGRTLLYAFLIAYAWLDLVKLFRYLELTA